MEDTDNFAYIIAEMRRKEEEARHVREEWARWREATRRDARAAWIVATFFILVLAVVCYFGG